MPSHRMGPLYGWLLLLPAMVLMAAFTHWPTLVTIYRSFFTSGTVIRPARFAGLENYQRLLDDPVFMEVMGNTLLFAAGTVPTAIALALGMALWANKAMAGKGFLRLAYFTPTILPMVAVANIWLFFYTPDIGLLDQVLTSLGGSGHNWLGDPSTVLWCLVATTVWKEAGFFMIFYLAALQNLSPELREAALLEGAGRLTTFRRVVFPLLMPTTIFVLINAVLNAFKLVDHLFILTKGGPNNASNLLLYYIYENAFSFFDPNYASTLTVIMLLMLALLAVLQFGFLDKRVHYR
ncbi:MAG: carbohydrate ABC transporter permease [Desulfovermiculus sp.]